MAESLDGAVVKTLRHATRIAEANRDLVNRLLAFVREGRRQPRQQRLNLIGRQADLLAAPFMRRSRVRRTPFAVDDYDGDLPLALCQRVFARLEVASERRC